MGDALHQCTCGCTEVHTIGRRVCADGSTVKFWSDGTVTDAFGIVCGGIGAARSQDGARANLRAAHVAMGDACILERSELVGGLKRARVAARRSGATFEDIRRALFAPTDDGSGVGGPARWDVYQADRRGRPTVRVWKLPRIQFPGLAVWDHCSNGYGGRYELVSYDRSGVAMTTGIRFSRISDVRAHLAEVSS